MAKFCTKCGGPLPEGVSFCPKCGATIGQTQAAAQPTAPPQQPPVQQQQQPMPPPQQPYYGQTQPYAPMPGKSNKKLIIGVLVAVIAIVIVLLVVFLVLGGADSRFVGEWEYDLGGGQTTNLKFNSDGTAESGSNGIYYSEGKWSIEGDKLCFEGEETWGIESEKTCYEFEFSDNNKKLTIKGDSDMGDITLTKK